MVPEVLDWIYTVDVCSGTLILWASVLERDSYPFNIGSTQSNNKLNNQDQQKISRPHFYLKPWGIEESAMSIYLHITILAFPLPFTTRDLMLLFRKSLSKNGLMTRSTKTHPLSTHLNYTRFNFNPLEEYTLLLVERKKCKQPFGSLNMSGVVSIVLQRIKIIKTFSNVSFASQFGPQMFFLFGHWMHLPFVSLSGHVYSRKKCWTKQWIEILTSLIVD